MCVHISHWRMNIYKKKNVHGQLLTRWGGGWLKKKTVRGGPTFNALEHYSDEFIIAIRILLLTFYCRLFGILFSTRELNNKNINK